MSGSAGVGATAVTELKLDDGTAEQKIGANSGGTSSVEFIWLNRFSPGAAAFPYRLQQVSVYFPGAADNVLKPLLLGRGVDAPMPVILLGALGGMATGGILGMFVGATLLALGYQVFTGWVADDPGEVATDTAAAKEPPTQLAPAGPQTTT